MLIHIAIAEAQTDVSIQLSSYQLACELSFCSFLCFRDCGEMGLSHIIGRVVKLYIAYDQELNDI